MNRAYFALIAVLVFLVLGIGAIAFMRSTANLRPTTPAPQLPLSPTTPSPTTSTTPPSSPEPPKQNQIALTITSPKNGAQVSSPVLKITGVTVPSADVAINELDAQADNQGNFQANLTLEEGDNTISIVASDDSGNFTEQDITVTYTPPQ